MGGFGRIHEKRLHEQMKHCYYYADRSGSSPRSLSRYARKPRRRLFGQGVDMFYRLGKSRKPKRFIDRKAYKDSRHSRIRWFRGSRFQEPISQPIELQLRPYTVDATDEDQFLPPYMSQSIELFRDDLIEAMEEFGVDNLEKYEVRITDPDDGAIYSNYKAVNIIGAVRAADLNQSTYETTDGVPLIEVAFDELVLREVGLQELLLFRLAENLKTILVHEALRDHLIKKGFNTGGPGFQDVEFYKLDETAIL